MIIIKTPQNAYKICLQAICMSFTCDLKFDIFDFLTFDILQITCNFSHFL